MVVDTLGVGRECLFRAAVVERTTKRKRYDWAAIQRYHDAGNDRNACMAKFGFGIAGWYKANRRGKLTARRSLRKTYDWVAVQQYYDERHTYRDCRVRFGFSAEAWRKAVRRGEVTARSARLPLERILAESKSRWSIKRRLLEAGILVNRCDECGLTEWRNRPLSMQLHHRNGVGNDHRIDNLAMLCPNCHSQTPTFGTRNRKQKHLQRRTEGEFPGGVIGNTSRSEREDSRFETLPGR